MCDERGIVISKVIFVPLIRSLRLVPFALLNDVGFDFAALLFILMQ